MRRLIMSRLIWIYTVCLFLCFGVQGRELTTLHKYAYEAHQCLCHLLQGIDTLSGEATLSKLFCIPSQNGQDFAPLGSRFFPFSSAGCAVRLATRGRGFNPRRGLQHSFMEIDREIFSTVILSLVLIQEGQLSVSGERMCIILVNRLED